MDNGRGFEMEFGIKIAVQFSENMWFVGGWWDWKSVGCAFYEHTENTWFGRSKMYFLVVMSHPMLCVTAKFCKYKCSLDRLSCSKNCNPWPCCPMSSCWQYCTWTWLPGHLHISQGPVFALLPGQQTLFTVDFTARGAHPVPPLNREMY